MKTILRVAVVSCLLGAAAGVTTALAGPWVLNPKEFYSQFLAGASRTADWFDSGGNRAKLLGGGRSSEYSLTSYNEFGWRKGVNVVLVAPFKSVNFRQDGTGFDGTESGLQDLGVGFRLGLVRGSTPVAVQLDWRGPAGYNRSLSPRLGEGSQDVSAQLLAGSSLTGLHAFVQAGGGYRARFSMPEDSLLTAAGGGAADTARFERGDAGEVFYSADVGVWVLPRLLLAGNVNGLSQSGRGDRRSVLEAGPRLIYRVDDALDLIAGSSHSLAGENTPKDDRYFVGLAFKGTKLTRYQGYTGSAEDR